MNNSLASLLLLSLLFLLSEVQSWSCSSSNYGRLPANRAAMFKKTVPKNITDTISKLFPESKSPAPGFVQKDIYYNCTKDNCYMNITYVSEGAGYHNTFGYAFWNTQTMQPNLTSMVTIFPDFSASDSGGCLESGDSLRFGPFPKGTIIVYWIRADGYGNPGNDVWWSKVNEGTWKNADNFLHYGWFEYPEYKVILNGGEDLYGGGDKDFNDVMWLTEIDGFSTGPIEQVKNKVPTTCVAFDPNKFPEKILSTDCILQTVMDDYISGDRQCISYFRLPVGWSVAPLDSTLQNALKSSSIWGDSLCAIGANSTGGVTANGIIYSTTIKNCTATNVDMIIDKDTGRPCYYAACSARVIIRKDQLNPVCDFQPPGYCIPSFTGSITNNSIAIPSNTLFANLVPNFSVNYSIPIKIKNTLQIFVLIDTFNTGSSSTSNDQLIPVIQSLKNLIPTAGEAVTGVSWGHTASTSSSDPPTIGLPFVYTSSELESSSYIQYYGGTRDTSPILGTLSVLLKSTTLGFTSSDSDGITQRVVYVLSKSKPQTSDVSALVSALQTAEIPVIFCVTGSSALTSWNNLLSSYYIPRASVVEISWPDMSKNNNYNKGWQSLALAKAVPFISNITFTITQNTLSSFGSIITLPAYTKASLPITLSSPPTAANTAAVGTYYANLLYMKLPNTIPGTKTAPLIPGQMQLRVIGSSYSIPIKIFWNEPPALLQNPITVNCLQNAVSCAVNLIDDPLNSNLDPNKNVLDIVFLSLKDLGGNNVFNTQFSSVTTTYGTTTPKTLSFNTNTANVTGVNLVPVTNTYGSYVLSYQITDGCLRSPIGTVNINILFVNQMPTCSNIGSLPPLEAGRSQTFSFSDKISDLESTFSQLSIIWVSPPTDSIAFISSQNSPVILNNVYVADSTWTITGSSEGTSIYYFQVRDNDANPLTSTTCSLNVQITPRDLPPVISASQTVLITDPGVTDSITVNITDLVLGGTNDFYMKAISIDKSQISLLKPSIPGDSRNYNFFDEISDNNKIASVSLTAGTASFPISWTPNFNHTSTISHTFSIWAVDEKNQISNTITITLKVPPNVAPSCLPTTSVTTFDEASDSTTIRTINISGTDSLYQNDKLTFTFTSLPTLGTIMDKNNVPITLGTVLTFPAQSSHLTNDNSTYPIKYTQYIYKNGADSFAGYFTDVEGAVSGTCTTPIVLTPVNNPPTTSNIMFYVQASSSEQFNLIGNDIDFNDVPSTESIRLKFLNVSGLAGNITRNCDSVIVQDNMTLPTNCEWSFTYNSSTFNTTETFTYQVLDSQNATSAIATGTIHVTFVPPNNTAPLSSNGTFSGWEDTELKVDLIDLFNDTEDSSSYIRVYLSSLPSKGVLLDSTRTAAKTNSLLMRSDISVPLYYMPEANWFGNDSFTFYVLDTKSLSSENATVTLNISSVNDPPIISITPLDKQTVNRTQSASVLITISDFDSEWVYLSSVSPNDLDLNPLISTATMDGSPLDSKEFKLDYRTGLPSYFGPPPGFRNPDLPFIWSPLSSCPDDKTMTISFQASDSDNGYSSKVTSTFDIQPNNPPTIYHLNADNSDYILTYLEDQQTSYLADLMATDIDLYHRTDLNISITSVGHVVTLKRGDEIISEDNLPFLLNSSSQTTYTKAQVSMTVPKDWFGNYTFSFYAKDKNLPISGVSDIQSVVLSILPVNDPPVTDNVYLTIPEGTCVVLCPPTVEWSPNTTPSVSIRATDVDSTDLIIQFERIDTGFGLLGYKGAEYNSGLNYLDIVTTEKNFSVATENQFWFQPVPLKHSENCTKNGNGDWENCAIYYSIPFQVSDGFNFSSTAYIHITVTPVNQVPVATDITFTTLQDQEFDFTDFNSYISDDDNTDDELTVWITSVNYGNQGSFSDVNGVQLAYPLSDDVSISKFLRFIPDTHKYSDPYYVPLGVIKYYVQDPEGANSAPATISVFVTPVTHAFNYTGILNITILEDTFAQLYFGRRDIDWTNIDQGEGIITITSFTSIGRWELCSGYTCVQQTSFPFGFDPSTSSLKFVPRINEYGDNYANFSFSLKLKDSHNTDTVNYDYIINVLPVNDPPILIPNWNISLPVVGDEDGYVTFSFDGYDIDNAPSTLNAQIISMGSGVSGTFRRCNQDPPIVPSCSVGTKLSLTSPPQVIAPVSYQTITIGPKRSTVEAAHWLFSFIPLEDANGYTNLMLIIFDSSLSPSPTVAVKITILPINDAPKYEVTVAEIPPDNGKTKESLDNSPYIFTFTKMKDPDFYDAPIIFTASTSSGYFYFSGKNTNKDITKNCVMAKTNNGKKGDANSTLTCEINFQKLLVIANQLTLSPEWETATVVRPNTTLSLWVNFVLNDKGNEDYRGVSYNLSCIQNLNITKSFDPIFAAIVTEKPGSSSSFATIGAAVGVGLAIIAAIAVAFAFRQEKLNAETELASMLADTSAAGENISPLYEPATVTVHSAVFRPA